MFVKVPAAALELIAGKSDADKIDPHGKLLIFRLYLAIASTLLDQCLPVHGKGEHDVSPHFPSVQRAVEASKLYRVVTVKETM